MTVCFWGPDGVKVKHGGGADLYIKQPPMEIISGGKRPPRGSVNADILLLHSHEPRRRLGVVTKEPT